VNDRAVQRRSFLGRLKARLRVARSRMVRERMSPDRIAAGWAIGMFVGCSIPFGFQLIVSIPLALVTKTSKIGATLGTFITNPVTIFFIYPAQTWVVYRLLFGGDPQLPSEWTMEAVGGLAGKTVASFFIGGLALAFILAPITFFAVRKMVVDFRAAMERRRTRRAAE